MQVQFSKKTLPYLQRAVWEVKNEEFTQEVKLTDSLPDIGRILGVWGQPLVRSKEWRASSMSVSGGVMVWVLYTPEEGAPQCVEAWVPFQMQWEFGQTQHDGTIRVACLLKGIDARSLSARKMMVRTVLSVAGEALEPAQTQWYQPVDVPEDLQVLQERYPVDLPTEAGEKVLTLDEELSPSLSSGQIRKILRCTLQPEIAEQKIMADKLVFRGSAVGAMLYECEDGSLQDFSFEIPFSQFAELEREYDSFAFSDVIPAVTNLETDIQDNGTVRLKAGLVGQYVIFDRTVLDVVADAYSVKRSVKLEQQSLEVPAVLNMKQENFRVEVSGEGIPDTVTDMRMLLSHPLCGKSGDKIHLEIPGSFQFLGMDGEGKQTDGHIRWEKTLDIPADERITVMARSCPKGKTGEFSVEMLMTAPADIPMVTAIELAESLTPNEERPSLILRHAGKDSLWEIAKSCGSTMDAIRQRNAIGDELLEDQMLLIPVI